MTQAYWISPAISSASRRDWRQDVLLGIVADEIAQFLQLRRACFRQHRFNGGLSYISQYHIALPYLNPACYTAPMEADAVLHLSVSGAVLRAIQCGTFFQKMKRKFHKPPFSMISAQNSGAPSFSEVRRIYFYVRFYRQFNALTISARCSAVRRG